MAEMLEGAGNLESTTVYLWRNAKVVKGGRRFSLSALVVVGDRNGSVGIGYGKAGGAPAAIEKAQKNARKNLTKINLQGGTIPHQVEGRYCASKVRLIPAAPGTGVIAGGTVRAVLEMAGVRDCLTKAYGSNNQKNLVKAAIEGLTRLQPRESIAELRNVVIESSAVEEVLEASRRWAPKVSGGDRARGPVNKVGQRTGRPQRGGRGRRREDEQQPANQPPAPQVSVSSPAGVAAVPAPPASETPAAGEGAGQNQ